jgi:hypothetical protein
MSKVVIEAARQQVRVVCNEGGVLWKVDKQVLCALRLKQYGSAADYARAAERCRMVQFVAAVN